MVKLWQRLDSSSRRPAASFGKVCFAWAWFLALLCCAGKPVPPLHSIVDGDWETVCIQQSGDFPALRIRLHLEQARLIERHEISYKDADCEQAALVQDLAGRYALSVSPKDFHYKIDLEFTIVQATALHGQTQTLLQNSHYCGLESWPLGLAQDIALQSGHGCRSLGVLPVLNWNLIEVKSGSRLRFAAEIEHDNIRPSLVESEVPTLSFQRQEAQ